MAGHRIDRAHLFARQETYLSNHYLGLHAVVVSVALAVAGTAAASFLGLASSYRPYVPLLWLMLTASLLATAVAYAGTVTGAVILPSRLPAMPDLILPLLLGLSEFFLFGILSHQITGVTSPQSVTEAWFIALAGFGLFSAASVARARSVIVRGRYDSNVHPTVTQYVHRLLTDIVASASTALLGVAAFLLELANHGEVRWFSYAFVGLAIVAFSAGFRSHANSRAGFEAMLK